MGTETGLYTCAGKTQLPWGLEDEVGDRQPDAVVGGLVVSPTLLHPVSQHRLSPSSCLPFVVKLCPWS